MNRCKAPIYGIQGLVDYYCILPTLHSGPHKSWPQVEKEKFDMANGDKPPGKGDEPQPKQPEPKPEEPSEPAKPQ